VSTGANCLIVQKPEGWYMKMQRWPYGETEEYDVEGPFATQEEAEDSLDFYANPGGFIVCPLKEDA